MDRPSWAGRHCTLAEYHSLVRDGVLEEDERVQLLRGTLVAMTPQGVAHAHAIRELIQCFVLAVTGRAKVLVQLPLTLGHDSEPEPDLAIVTLADAARVGGHPSAALLVVEVAGDSLAQDRGVKREIYARASIPESWIVDLAGRAVEVYRDPDASAGVYRGVSRFGGEALLAPLAFPDSSLPVAPPCR